MSVFNSHAITSLVLPFQSQPASRLLLPLLQHRQRRQTRLSLGADAPRVAGFAAGSTSAASSSQVVTDRSGGRVDGGVGGTGSLEGYMDRVSDCNGGREGKQEFHPFQTESGDVVGYIHKDFWHILSKHEETFSLVDPPGTATAATTNAGRRRQGAFSAASTAAAGSALPPVTFAPRLLPAPAEKKTAAVAAVLARLRDEGLVPGWRNELYPVGVSFHSPPSFLVERAAAPLFGIKAYGVHLNGFVRTPFEVGERGTAASNVRLWVAKRSATKPTFPGKLDHLVAGGQPFNMSCVDNVVKECAEEAGIPDSLARRAVAVGAVSYETASGWSLKRDVLFCYDLELPESFVPHNTDGEVESFELLPVADVAEVVRTTRNYKTNCNLVVIDFLMRHGFITPDQPGYLELLCSLRQGDCS